MTETLMWTERAGRAAVHGRSGGRCEVTGFDIATDWAHRLARGQGGSWAPWNGLHLDHMFHAWCHANPRAAVAGGWIVLPGADPRLVPVWLNLPWPGWWTFADPADGGPHVLTPWTQTDGPLGPRPELPGWVP